MVSRKGFWAIAFQEEAMSRIIGWIVSFTLVAATSFAQPAATSSDLGSFVGDVPKIYHLTTDFSPKSVDEAMRLIRKHAAENPGRYAAESRAIPGSSPEIERLLRSELGPTHKWGPAVTRAQAEQLMQLRTSNPELFLDPTRKDAAEKDFIVRALAQPMYAKVIGPNEAWYGACTLTLALPPLSSGTGSLEDFATEHGALELVSHVSEIVAGRWKKERRHNCEFFKEKPPTPTRELALLIALVRKHRQDLCEGRNNYFGETASYNAELIRAVMEDQALVQSGVYKYLFGQGERNIPLEAAEWIDGNADNMTRYLENEQWLEELGWGAWALSAPPKNLLENAADTAKVVQRVVAHNSILVRAVALPDFAPNDVPLKRPKVMTLHRENPLTMLIALGAALAGSSADPTLAGTYEIRTYGDVKKVIIKGRGTRDDEPVSFHEYLLKVEAMQRR